MAEKRGVNRLDIMGLAYVRRNPSGPLFEAQIVNINHQGVKVYMKEPISGQTEIQICYLSCLADGTYKEIGETIKAQRAWIKQNGRWYSIGFKFDGLNQKDHGSTLTFLNRYCQIK
jgi:hypothetical protein